MILKIFFMIVLFIVLCIPVIYARLRDKPVIYRVSGVGIAVINPDILLEIRLLRLGYYKQPGRSDSKHCWFKPSPKNRWKRDALEPTIVP